MTERHYWTNDWNDQGTAMREDAYLTQAPSDTDACASAISNMIASHAPEPGESVDAGPIAEGDCWSKVPREWTEREIADYAESRGVHPDDLIVKRPDQHPGLQHHAWISVRAMVYAARIVIDETAEADA